MPVLKNRNTGGTSVSTPSAWLWFQNGIASPPETEWQLVAAGDVRKLRANVSDQPFSALADAISVLNVCYQGAK